MTTRLLHSSQASGLSGAGRHYDAPRQALRDRRSGQKLSLRGSEPLHVGCLPLIRRISGSLHQAVRVDWRAAAAGTEVAVALLDGDEQLAHGMVSSDGYVDLWVPCVDEERQASVEVDGQPIGSVPLSPQRQWTVHIVHHSHLDIGYTDPQGVVLRHHLEYLDAALELCDATDSHDDDSRFRWSVESILPAIRWLGARPEVQVTRFLDRVREGRIELTGLPFQLHTEACSEEELRRLLRFARDLRTAHGVRIESAMHTDVCGAVVGIVDALSDAGIRYLAAAHNWAGRSVPYLTGGTALPRPFWWRSAAGRRLLVWYTDTAHGMAYMEGNIVGLAENHDLVEDVLPAYLDGVANRYAPYGPEVFGWNGGMEAVADQRPPYPFDVLHLRVQGGHSDNAGPNPAPARIAERWNQTYEWPRLRTSTNNDFFSDIEERYGDELEEFTGDWTDWWADGMASGARPLGWTRRAQATLRSAESVHALADARSRVAETPADLFDDAYDEVALFDEHTWGAANPWDDHEDGTGSGQKQWTWKESLAIHAADHADDLLHSGVRRLGTALRSAGPDCIQVLNLGPGWRTDMVRAFIPASVVALDHDVVLTEHRTGDQVPSEVEEVRPEEQPTRPAGRWVRFLAHSVPCVGTARFDINDGTSDPNQPLERSGEVVELGTADYRVQVNTRRGVLSSVRYRDRELVDVEARAGMNECIRDTYGSAPFVNHLSGHLQARDRELLAERQVAGSGSVVEAVRTPIADRLVIERVLPGAQWLQTTIEVPHVVARVEITNRILKDPSPAKESIYFAFPFAASGPGQWELTGGVGGTDIASVPGSPDHLSFIRHWVSFDDDDVTIAWSTLEAPLVHIGDIPLPYAPFPRTLEPARVEPATVYSWAINNIWDTNFPPQQAGEMVFRYAIAADNNSSARDLAMRTSAGLTDPLVGILTRGGPAEDVLLECRHPEVRITSIGPADAEDAITIRLRSVAPTSERVTLGAGSLPVSRAWIVGGMADPVEVAVENGKLTIDIAAETTLELKLELVRQE